MNIASHNSHTIAARDLRPGDVIVEHFGNRWAEWKPDSVGTQDAPFPAIVCRSETRTTFYAPNDEVFIWPRSKRVSFYG